MKKSTFICVLTVLFMSHGAIAAGDASQLNHHVLGVFIGKTKTDEEKASTYGVEYEYRIDTMFGVGLVYEETPDAHHGDGAELIVALAYVHPYKGLRLGLGAGEETIDHHEESLTRFSVAYDFHVGNVGIAPTFNRDRIDGHNIDVYGVAVSVGF